MEGTHNGMGMNNIAVHRRGRLNLPDNIPNGVSVDAFGRIQSAPTVDVYLKQFISIPL